MKLSRLKELKADFKKYGRMIRVFDQVTLKYFIFKNHKDKEKFFECWDDLVVKVE